MRKEEKRNARRIHLTEPVAASLSHFSVSLIDLSTSGARIQHDSPLAFTPGKRFNLEFRCEGESFTLLCQVVRSRMEQHRTVDRKPVYTSGVRFIDLDEPSIERLWGLIGVLAIEVLQQEAFAADLPVDFELRAH